MLRFAPLDSSELLVCTLPALGLLAVTMLWGLLRQRLRR
jgi:hypothetical protein